jgi:hypothetical protein
VQELACRVRTAVNPEMTKTTKRDEVREGRTQSRGIGPRLQVVGMQPVLPRLSDATAHAAVLVAGEDGSQERLPFGRLVQTLTFRCDSTLPCWVSGSRLSTDMGCAAVAFGNSKESHHPMDSSHLDSALIRQGEHRTIAHHIFADHPVAMLVGGVASIVIDDVDIPPVLSSIPSRDVPASALAGGRITDWQILDGSSHRGGDASP